MEEVVHTYMPSMPTASLLPNANVHALFSQQDFIMGPKACVHITRLYYIRHALIKLIIVMFES